MSPRKNEELKGEMKREGFAPVDRARSVPAFGSGNREELHTSCRNELVLSFVVLFAFRIRYQFEGIKDLSG